MEGYDDSEEEDDVDGDLRRRVGLMGDLDGRDARKGEGDVSREDGRDSGDGFVDGDGGRESGMLTNSLSSGVLISERNSSSSRSAKGNS